MPDPFDALFDAEEYLYFMAETLRAEDTPAQVDHLERRLGLAPPRRILDLGCGHGRHALEFSRRGYEVLGVDRVEAFLAVARAEAARESLTAEFRRGDFAALTEPSRWDVATFLFDAFGFFEDAQQFEALCAANAALVSGGQLVLDLRHRDFMSRIAPVSVHDKGNGDLMIDRNRFDPTTGRLYDQRTYLRAGRARDAAFSMRLYTLPELRVLLALAGFAVEHVGGGYDDSAFSSQRPRMLVFARKTAEPVAGARERLSSAL